MVIAKVDLKRARRYEDDWLALYFDRPTIENFNLDKPSHTIT